MLETSWLAEELLASHEGLCSMELASYKTGLTQNLSQLRLGNNHGFDFNDV
jgi:hypothetical protein